MRERRQIRRFFDDHALIDIIVFAREDLLVLLYRRELWDMIYFVKNTFELCAERKVLLMCESFFVELDEFA